MIVTSVVTARVVWLFNVMDLNPRGRYIYDQLFPWLVERYHFAKAPAHPHDRVENALMFFDGRFINRANEAIDVTLKVYNDGVVGETCSTTDDSEAFLVDLFTAAVRDLGLTFTDSMVHRTIYLSELNLASEHRLDSINPRMREFSAALSEAFGTGCELTSLGFGGDPATQPTFKFERKANVPFSQNRYWSIAGLKTSAHVALLEQLEALLIA